MAVVQLRVLIGDANAMIPLYTRTPELEIAVLLLKVIQSLCNSSKIVPGASFAGPSNSIDESFGAKQMFSDFEDILFDCASSLQHAFITKEIELPKTEQVRIETRNYYHMIGMYVTITYCT